MIEVITEEYPDIRVRGLMCMAPLSENPEDARPVFEQAREMFETIRRLGTETKPPTAIIACSFWSNFECVPDLFFLGVLESNFFSQLRFDFQQFYWGSKL